MHRLFPNPPKPTFSVTRDLDISFAYKPQSCPHQLALERRADQQFLAMLDAYRDTGGLARKAEVLTHFQTRGGPDEDLLDSWIFRRKVICFQWQSQDWLPWFQFNSFTLEPHPQLKLLFDELADVHEPLEMAEWFAEPNSWLAGRATVDTLLSDLTAVVHAARAERFIALG